MEKDNQWFNSMFIKQEEAIVMSTIYILFWALCTFVCSTDVMCVYVIMAHSTDDSPGLGWSVHMDLKAINYNICLAI